MISPLALPDEYGWRWTRESVAHAVETGLIEDPDEWELLEGRLYRRMGQGYRHRQSGRLTEAALRRVFGETYGVSGVATLPLDGSSEPHPDITVLRGNAYAFNERAETAADAALLVEIVDSRPDTADQKIALYARHGIAEYWIVRTDRREVAVHRGPRQDGTWREVRVYAEGEEVTPAEASAGVSVTSLFPPE